MHFFIRKEQGKVLCFVSRTISNPSREINDEIYSKDYFQINEHGPNFKTEFYNFCI